MALYAMREPTDWAKLAEEFKANTRPHAGFFTWETDKSVAEEGVLIEFAEALQEQNALFFEKAFHRGEDRDPPDCEARGLDGRRVGIELTELVDPASAAAARADEPYVPKYWSNADILAGLRERLQAKDRANPKDGPYDEYLLLIYTDEPGLTPDSAKNTITSTSFKPAQLIDSVYFLLSPYPGFHTCFKLQLDRRITWG